MNRTRIHVKLVHAPIHAETLHAFVGGSSASGGIVSFEGVVRAEGDPDHGELVGLEYEAHEDMAIHQLEQLAATAIDRWGVWRVAIAHRLGPVPVGEASVMIVVACPHRGEAFDSCRWIIDALKKDVPIWKRDVFADGFTRWVEQRAAKDE